MSAAIEISDAPIEPKWDNFLAATPGNHHAQTSLWGQLKSSDRGGLVRVMARQGGEIVAGAQMMLVHLPLLGAAGYIARGPVVADHDPAVVEPLLHALRKEARQLGLHYLLMQPPEGEESLGDELRDCGFSPGKFAPQATATVKIDLERDCDTLLSRMKKNTRRLIRRGMAEGLSAHEAGEADIPIFHRLLSATAERQGFAPVSLEYLEAMWHLMAPSGWIKLFVVEHDGEPVSSEIAVAFGDTVVAKNLGWSGRDGSLGPNQLLQWFTITWAKQAGYHYYDLEGIDAGLAAAARSGQIQVTPQDHGRTYFKLNYGGEIVFLPGSYEHLEPGLLHWAYEHGVRPLLSPQYLDRLAAHLRAA